MTTPHSTSVRRHRTTAAAGVLGVVVSALAGPALLGTPASAAAPASPAAGSSDVVVALLGADAASGPSARVQARDGRLRPGCRTYPLRYAVDGAEDDWLLELVVTDRAGDEVASVSLHGVNSPPRGRAPITLCRASVRAGRFTVEGVLTERGGYEQVEHAVEGDRFWLTRR
jgi:hypothetical protein